MHPSNYSLDDILRDKPDCFAIPHRFVPVSNRCKQCAAQQACANVSAQMFKALACKMIEGKSINDLPYGLNDGRSIVGAIFHCAPESDWSRPCKRRDLPRLFDRAKYAFETEPPFSPDDFLIERELEEGLSETQDNAEVQTSDEPTATLNEVLPADVDDVSDGNVSITKNMAKPDLNADLPHGTVDAAAADKVDPDVFSNEPAASCNGIAALQASTDSAAQLKDVEDGDAVERYDDCDDLLEDVNDVLVAASGSSQQTPASVGMENSKSKPEPVYHFPSSWHAELDGLSDDDLETRLMSLCGAASDYGLVREEYCAINLELNARQRWAPRFRPFLAVPKRPGKGLDTNQKWLSHDRKILDLDWLHKSGAKYAAKDVRFHSLLLGDQLDVTLAEAFVQKNISTEKRVSEIFRLGTSDQWQLGMLMTEEVRTRWRHLDEQEGRLMAQLRDLVARRRVAMDIKDLLCLWKADQVCEGKSRYLIAKVHGWQLGKVPLALNTISTKLRAMRRIVQDCSKQMPRMNMVEADSVVPVHHK